MLVIAMELIWKKKNRFRMRAVHMDNLRGLLGIRRMDKVPNTQLRELFFDGSVLWREWRMTRLLRGSM